jgi:hypothetical protein
VAFGTNCRSAPVPFIFLRHYCTQTRVDLFCFLDAAKFFWTTIALAPKTMSPRSAMCSVIPFREEPLARRW